MAAEIRLGTKMYANSVGPEVGDVVQGATGIGDVFEVVPDGMGGHVCVTVQWRTPAMSTAQDAQSLSPVPIPAQSLTFVRRK